MPTLPYRLGLPTFAFAGWKNRYFDARPSPLASYASVFNTVEGNTTFYRVPGRNTVAGWRDAVAGRDFQFCFKLPRGVTHGESPDLDELKQFLRNIEPLEPNLGPLLVQFPARVGPADLDTMATVFEQLPAAWRSVIEVRHQAFFTRPALLDPLIQRFGAGRVVMDTRALYRGDREHPEVLAALHEKPDLPVLPELYNDLAFIRLVLHPDRRDNQRYIDDWIPRFARWLDGGTAAYMMIHCPNNLHCPELAAGFHDTLGGHVAPLASLPPWPVPLQQGLW